MGKDNDVRDTFLSLGESLPSRPPAVTGSARTIAAWIGPPPQHYKRLGGLLNPSVFSLPSPCCPSGFFWVGSHIYSTVAKMCTGKCSKFIGISLYPLVLINIICNVLLLFPDWSADYIQNSDTQITPQALYFGGLIGGGLLILIPAIHIQATGKKGCCANRCGMFLSIIFAAVGVAGAVYGFVVSILGMVNGPACLYEYHNSTSGTISKEWGIPFKTDVGKFNNESYLFDPNLWDICEEPKGVVEFNVILFSMMLASSGIAFILCVIQMLNGLFGCLCGTCRGKSGGAI
ncbi:transmembrane 4 L6 family member 5-like [Ambystoma mexicanum]|uniref:transmembrane 4 L6 family member 5-like n=1 Tax=Ambystoma mexicanum TaxID=8296 RepID=UPI0037E8EF3D